VVHEVGVGDDLVALFPPGELEFVLLLQRPLPHSRPPLRDAPPSASATTPVAPVDIERKAVIPRRLKRPVRSLIRLTHSRA